MSSRWLACLLLSLFLPGGGAFSAAPEDEGVRVNVQRVEAAVVVDVDMTVPVPVASAWAVLTDFERMPQFLPNLQESRVLERQGARVILYQKGETQHGIVHLDYESLRALELRPFERIDSISLKGSMRSMVSSIALASTGQGTHIHYEARAVPDSTLARLVLSAEAVGEEIRGQFKAMRAEMLRREGTRAAQPAPAVNHPA